MINSINPTTSNRKRTRRALTVNSVRWFPADSIPMQEWAYVKWKERNTEGVLVWRTGIFVSEHLCEGYIWVVPTDRPHTEKVLNTVEVAKVAYVK